jgi:hypothetical protein
MQITITVVNPTAELFATLLGFAQGPVNAPVNPTAPCADTCAHEPAVYTFRTPGDLENLYLGAQVHWSGQKYVFHGEVLDVFPDALDDDTAVRVRRDDTGKIVRLTYNDLQVGTLSLR